MPKRILIVVVAIAVIGAIVATGFMGRWFVGEERVKLIQRGSSTVLPLAVAWAEKFEGADISVSGGGTSHGLHALLLGEADLGDASRLLMGSDYAAVRGDPDLVMPDGTATAPAPTGVWPEKWVVAYDVLAIVVNNQNTWAMELTYEQLRHIFAFNASQPAAVYWDEVQGLSGAPHEGIEIYAPDEASGTYDFFFASIIEDWGEDSQEMKPRLESTDGVYHPSADDNVILNAIKSKKNAIGYLGFAYLVETPGVVTAVRLSKSGTTFVEPSLDNVAIYPMARPLLIYTNGIPDDSSPKGSAIRDYLRFILSEEGQSMVTEVGYVKIGLVNTALLDTQRAKIEG